MNKVNCPQRDQIHAYVLGNADDCQAEALNGHIADCSQCQAIADELESSSDEIIDLLQVAEPLDDYSSEPECERVVARAKDFEPAPSTSAQRSGDSIADDELPLPRQLGDYRITERIGGHMGVVYKAVHTMLGRTVAVKVLPRRALADERAVARFEREMKAIGRLNHANIVHADHASRIDGRLVLVMEYIDGQNLSELVRSRGPLPIADACEVVCRAAKGLQYVHEQGLLHRDMKPSNLMLARDGQVKVLDLGLACFRTRHPDAGDVTGAGHAVGTADYMAPEQVADSQSADTRADVYGLGCTLYKILSGRAPFDAPRFESVFDKMKAHVSEPVPPIEEFRRDVPKELVSILDRMLAKDPGDRFATPGQVAAALEPFTIGSDLRALATSWESRRRSNEQPVAIPVGQPFPWFWKLVTVAALVLALAVGGKIAFDKLGGGIAFIARNPSPRSTDQTDPSPDGTPTAGAKSTPQPTPGATPGEGGVGGVETPNPHQTFAVQVEVDHPDRVYRGPPAGPDGQGELMHVQVTSDKAGYLYLIYKSAGGKLRMLFPNKVQKENRISAGEQIHVPHPDAEFQLRVGPSYGRELLKAVVSIEPLEPKDFGVESLIDAGATPLRPEDVKDVFVQLKKKPVNWAERLVKITTRPGEQPEHARDDADVSATDPVTPSPGVASDEIPLLTSGETPGNLPDEAPKETPTERPVEIIGEAPEEAPAERPVEIIGEEPEETPAVRPAETAGPPAEKRAGEDVDWSSSPNVRQAFTVHVDVDHPDRIYRGAPAGPDGKGELVHVKVTSDKAGYLYLIHKSAGGKLSMLFPNKIQQDNKISANREIDVPHPDADFQLRVGPPYGKELLKAVVSLVPLEPEDFGVESLTTEDVTPLRPEDVKEVFVELKKKPLNWAEHQVAITTAPKVN